MQRLFQCHWTLNWKYFEYSGNTVIYWKWKTVLALYIYLYKYIYLCINNPIDFNCWLEGWGCNPVRVKALLPSHFISCHLRWISHGARTGCGKSCRKRRNMKRWLIFMASVYILLCVCVCNTNKINSQITMGSTIWTAEAAGNIRLFKGASTACTLTQRRKFWNAQNRTCMNVHIHTSICTQKTTPLPNLSLYTFY